MFVKKDLRKIPAIFYDAMKTDKENEDQNAAGDNAIGASLTELRLARRPTEFKEGSIKNVLCQPHYIPALRNLVSISLYDCQIRDLNGIGFFASQVDTHIDDHDDENGDVKMDDKNMDVSDSGTFGGPNSVCPNLEELNLGRNPIKNLPEEFSQLSKSLKSLWLDDCELEGSLPECLYELENLTMLRISNNSITEFKDDGVSKWKKMEVLCLDGNGIETIPKTFIELTKLKSLLIRKNKITCLPNGVPGKAHANLTLLHLSSNQLSSLPDSLSQCTSLKSIYANKNKLETLPTNLLQNMEHLSTCNLSNNEIKTLPTDFVERFGDPDVTSGNCTKFPGCVVSLMQNPIMGNEANKM